MIEHWEQKDRKKWDDYRARQTTEATLARLKAANKNRAINDFWVFEAEKVKKVKETNQNYE